MKIRLAKLALRISLIYAVAGTLWIVFSNRVLSALISDPDIRARWEVYKGWGFVGVTALLLYLLLRGYLWKSEQESAERKRAEEALNNNDRFLRLVMDMVPHFIFVKDKQSRHLLVNRACAEACKMDPEQMVGRSDSDLSPDSELAKSYMEDDREVIASGRPKFVPEQKLTDAYGQTRYLQTTKIPFPSSTISFTAAGNGEPAILGVAVDITERKKAEDALRERHAQLTEALQIAHLAYWEYDIPSDQFIFNDQFYNILRTTATRAGGYTMSSADYARRFVHPDDRAVVEEEIRKSLSATDSSFTRQLDHRTIFGDGEIGYFSVHIRVEKDAQGRTIRTHGACMDITERKKAEDALRQKQSQLVEATRIARLAYWEYDVTNDQFTFNDQFYNILRTSASREGGYTMSSAQYAKRFIHPDDRARVREESQKSLITNDRNFTQQLDHRIIYGDGEVGYFSIRVRVEKDAQGRTVKTHGANVDITEFKLAEQQLAESRNYFSKVINSLTDPIFVKDRQHRWVMLNEAFCDFMGRRRDELLGKTDRDFFPKQEADIFWAKDELVFSSGKENINEEKFTDGKGVVRTILTKKVLYTDDKGGQFILGIIRDITERTHAEQTLQMCQFSIDQASDAIFWLRRDAGFSYVNEQACRSLGYAREELMKLHLWDIDPYFPKERWDAEWIQFQKNRQGGGRQFESFHRRKDGSTFPVGISSKHLWFGDTELHIAVGRDISERKRAEEELRRANQSLQTLSKCNEALVRATDENKLLATICQIITEVGDYRMAWVGYADQDDAKSVRHVAQAGAESGYLQQLHVTWADNELGRGPVGTAIRTGRPAVFLNLAENPAFAPWRQEALRRGFASSVGLPLRAGDRTFGVLCVYSSRPDAFNAAATALLMELADDLAFGISSLRNRSERNRLEEQLRQSQKMEAIGLLAGGVAHDFNNMLTIIQGNASLLLNPQLDPQEWSACSRQIVQAAERAAGLTRQLLIFSRKQALQPADVDLNEVVGNMTKMLRRILGEDVVLQTNYAPQPVFIHADVGMIEQVLMNLLVNARDAMPAGGQLSIQTDRQDIVEAPVSKNPDALAGPHVCLTVSDTGCGISKENLVRIFDPFFTTKEVGKGTGLGLATVYSIVQQHRGWVTVTSEIDKGTAFKIYFPAVKAVRATKESAPQKLLQGSGTILVVEDELAVRTLVCHLLKRCGYTVLQAESGTEALKIWQERQGKIQLLLTDIIMPDGINGYELARRLKAAKPKLKVIYTSGYSGEVVGKGLELTEGVNFLQKPYVPQKLLKILHDNLVGTEDGNSRERLSAATKN